MLHDLVVLVFLPAKFVHQDEFSRSNTGGDTSYDKKYDTKADVQLRERSRHVVQTLTDMRRTKGLLATGVSAVETFLEAKFHGVVESFLINPILLSRFELILSKRLILIVPVVRHKFIKILFFNCLP